MKKQILVNLVVCLLILSCKSEETTSNQTQTTVEETFDFATSAFIEKLDTLVRRNELQTNSKIPKIIVCSFHSRDDSTLFIISQNPYYFGNDLIGHVFYDDYLVTFNSDSSANWRAILISENLSLGEIPEFYTEEKDFKENYNYNPYAWFYSLDPDDNIVLLKEGHF